MIAVTLIILRPTLAQAIDTGPTGAPSFEKAQHMSTAELAELVFGKAATNFIDARAGFLWGPVSGPDAPVDYIEFAEAPRATAFPGLCSLRVLTIMFNHLGMVVPPATKPARLLPTTAYTYFKRASPDPEAPCFAGPKVLPTSAFGYFQGHGLDHDELSAAEADFVIRVLEQVRRGAATSVRCDERNVQMIGFCRDKYAALKGDPLPGISGPTIKRCSDLTNYICVTFDTEVGYNRSIIETVATNATSINVSTFEIRSVSLSGGSFFREP